MVYHGTVVNRRHPARDGAWDDGAVPDLMQPPEEVWRYAPPPMHRGARWLAVLAPAVAVALIIGSVLWLQRSAAEDTEGRLDSPVVTSTVAGACTIMTNTVLGQRVEGPPRLKAAILADQNLAVRQMIGAISTLDDSVRLRDQPLDAWLADWNTLLTAREQYARQVAGGADGALRVPTVDGRPITERMDAAGGTVCPVPEILLDPYSGNDREV